MIDENGERVASYWVENDLGKIYHAFDELGSLSKTAKLEVVTESIGSLGALVSQAVRGRGDELFLVSTKALRHYRDLEGQPHKSDDRDAYLAARMRLFGMEGVRTPAPVSEEEQALARLIRLRFRLMDQKKISSVLRVDFLWRYRPRPHWSIVARRHRGTIRSDHRLRS